MPQINLSNVAAILGLAYAVPHFYGVIHPAGFARMARQFSRSTPIGIALILLATAVFLKFVSLETVSDFDNMKPFLYLLFGAVGVGTCVFVQDFIAVRGLAVLLLLAAKLMVDTARMAETEWRLVIVTWAYLWVFAGMWFTISPWRFRDLVAWSTATEQRTRLLSGLRVAFGLFVLALAFTVFK